MLHSAHLRSAILSAVLLLAACQPAPVATSSIAANADKYPYLPQFVDVSDLPKPMLAAPPQKGSPEFEREVQTIVARQARLNEEDKAIIESEDHIVPQMMVLPTLGASYTPEAYPALYTLLKHVASDAWRLCDINQDHFQSPRPWMADDRVQLIAPKITRYGYPSGHTATNTVWAYTLADIYPGMRDQFVQRANEIAQHRIDGGVHFPHDVQGGRDLANVIFPRMQANPRYQQELLAAKMELSGLNAAAAKPTGLLH